MQIHDTAHITKWVGQKQLLQRTVIFYVGEKLFEITCTESLRDGCLLIMDNGANWIALISGGFLNNTASKERSIIELSQFVDILGRDQAKAIIEAIYRAYHTPLWKVQYKPLSNEIGVHSKPVNVFYEGGPEGLHDFVSEIEKLKCESVVYYKVMD